MRLNYHSFGHVPLGGTVTHVFRLKNTDDIPLTVTRMKAACGCTVPKLSYEAEGERVYGHSALSREPSILTIPPGVVADLEVSMDTRSVPITNLDKTVGVMLTTDSPNGFYLSVETHIFVEKPFTQNPSGIKFSPAPMNGRTPSGTDLILNPGYDIVLTGLAEVPDNIEAELSLKPDGSGRIWRLDATLLPPMTKGVWQDSIFVKQALRDGTEIEPLEVRMRAQVVDDLITTPTRIAFATHGTPQPQPDGLSVTLKTLLAGHSFGIEQISLPVEHRDLFETSFEPVAADSSGNSYAWRIQLQCKPGTHIEKLTSGKLTVLLNDSQHPSVEVEYVVHPPRP